jgi:HEAT repeat protein
MPPRSPVEQQIADLQRLSAEGATPAVLQALTRALKHQSNLMVAKAAELSSSLQAKDLLPHLLAAWNRMFENAAKTDPQCWAKNALIRALTALGVQESAPFLRGVRYQQWEATWGGQEDTAITVRGGCALALLQSTDLPRLEIAQHLVITLTDDKTPVRIDGARALEALGGDEASLLLRLKARILDPEPQVLGQVFESLLGLEGDRAIPFLAEFLNAREEAVAEEASLALGASRSTQALEVLRKAWERHRGRRLGSVLLRSISALRIPEAIEFLAGIVRTEGKMDALDALDALALHGSTGEIAEAARGAASQRVEESIVGRVSSLFPPGR